MNLFIVLSLPWRRKKGFVVFTLKDQTVPLKPIPSLNLAHNQSAGMNEGGRSVPSWTSDTVKRHTIRMGFTSEIFQII